MKKMLCLIMLLGSLNVVAQNMNPVKWTFTCKKDATSNHYILHATAAIEAGWHVFSTEPGGDGFLIPTEITITSTSDVKNVKSTAMERRPITKDISGMGMVNFYEHDATFIVEFDADKPFTLTGKASFQCCNDTMCLPPMESPFSIKL